jgi:hypothetical protein
MFCIISGHCSATHHLKSFVHICQVTVWLHGDQHDVNLSQHPQIHAACTPGQQHVSVELIQFATGYSPDVNDHIWQCSSLCFIVSKHVCGSHSQLMSMCFCFPA